MSMDNKNMRLSFYLKKWSVLICIGLLLYGAGFSLALQRRGKETLNFLAMLKSNSARQVSAEGANSSLE